MLAHKESYHLYQAWGGWVSDKYLTEHSDILKNILPGDVVLADIAFDIADSIGFYCGELKRCAFTNGKLQLSRCRKSQEDCFSLNLCRASNWITSKYIAFLPLDYLIAAANGLCTIDIMAVVCCTFSNLCDSVVPIEWGSVKNTYQRRVIISV